MEEKEECIDYINEYERCLHEGQLMLKLLLDLISAVFLIVYIFAKLGHLFAVNFALLFGAMGTTIAVLSYLYYSSTSLEIGSVLFLFTSIRKMVVEKWKKRQAG